MFSFFKKFFLAQNQDIVGVLDIWSSLVRCVILDCKKWKIISSGESRQEYWAIKNWLITDLKAVISSVNESIENAESNLWQAVSTIYFWLNWDCDNFSNKSFKWHIQTIADEIWWKFWWYFSLPSVYYSWIKTSKNYLVIDIWAELTSISLVNDWVYKKSEMFWLWWNLFTKRVSKIFTTSFSEAEKIKLLFSFWKLKWWELSDIDFKSDLDLWLTALFVSLKNLWEDSLPSTIFLTWSSSLFKPLTERLRFEKAFYKKIQFKAQPNLRLLTSAWLNFSKWRKEETIVPWIPVRILAEFVLKIINKKK